jgi:Cdc6-like AAA superfamily ATPase
MSKKYNPFRPNQPVYRGMFAGRIDEIEKIDRILFQTRESNPSHILIHGERGIGKTSLLLVGNHFAKGEISWDNDWFNFLTLHITIRPTTTMVDLATRISSQIKRSLSNEEKALTIMKKSWNFLTRLQTSIISLAPQQHANPSQEELVDKTIYSIVDTVKALTEDTAVSELGMRQKKDGIVILIDEADQASKTLGLGIFLKNLSEVLVQENANKVLLILAGLPKVRDVLRESHESSLRLFDEFKLVPLSEDEVESVVRQGLDEAKKRKIIISISKGALQIISQFSEGYPHFVQQIAYSAYDFDSDNNIDVADVEKAMFHKSGALDLIGDRYYKHLYYDKIRQDSYRQILNIMAQRFNDWVTKKEIEQSFRGKKTALTNGIQALRERSIILSKPGRRGLYRLQWIGFAIWINRVNYRSQKEKSGFK